MKTNVPDMPSLYGARRRAADHDGPVHVVGVNEASTSTMRIGSARLLGHLLALRALVRPSLGVGIVCLGLLAALLSQAAGQPAKPLEDGVEKEFSTWMDVKVQESQKVFAALAMADYEAIETSAAKLKTLNALEKFVRRTTPGYQTQLRSFEFAVDEIRRQAKRENIEGVVMGFHQMTLSCVNCHKQIRRPAIGASAP